MRWLAAIALVVVVTLAAPAAARPFLAPLDASTPIEVWIAPGADGKPHPDDDLARAAIAAWAGASGGKIAIKFVPRMADARLRLLWVGASGGQYGEMRPIMVGERRGAEVFVRPVTDGMGRAISGRARRDRLYRDTIVYLTCVHELGHGFGMSHTADFADIMYSFEHGGDIEEYFLRYRRKLTRRRDVRKHPGLSRSDGRRLRQLYQ